MNYPKDLKYTKNDEWLRIEGNIGAIGISDYAQDQLSDIVYLEVALELGATGKKGDMFGTVESVKAASDVYLPVGGKIIEINQNLMDTPETINSDPYDQGWIIKLEITDEGELNDLMDAAAYEKNTQERG